MEKDYRNYSAEDLVFDLSFQDWVLNPDCSEAPAWESWVKENPQKKQAVYDAKYIVLTLKYFYKLSDIEKAQMRINLNQDFTSFPGEE